MFKSRADLYSYSLQKVILDLSRFTGILLPFGDVYRSEGNAAFDQITGRKLFSFDGSHWGVGAKGDKVEIITPSDLNLLKSEIRNEFGKVTVSKRDFLTMRFSFQRALKHRVMDGLIALTGEAVRDEFDYSFVEKSVPGINDVFDMDAVRMVDGCEEAMHMAKMMITRYIFAIFEDQRDYDWHQYTLFYRCDLRQLFMDMGMDIRIRDYYERKIIERERSDHEWNVIRMLR